MVTTDTRRPSRTNWTGSRRRVNFYPKKEVWRQKLRAANELPIGDEAAPNISLLWGTRGVGKTLNMSAMGEVMRQHYEAHNQDTKIITNYHLDFADYCSAYLVDELLEYHQWYDHSFALVDELTAFFHNRRSQARSAVDFSIFLTQIRKRKIEMVFTTQYPTQVDIQVLQQIDFFIQPMTFYLPDTPGRHTMLHIHDFWGHTTGQYRGADGRRKIWPPQPEDADWITPIYNVNSLFGAYDTDELQASMWGNTRENIIQRQWEKDTGRRPYDPDPNAPVAGPLPQPKAMPSTLLEYLESLKGTGRFALNSIREQVMEYDWNLDTPVKLRKFLENFGYNVTRRGSFYDVEWLRG